jgi:hypothetical protein
METTTREEQTRKYVRDLRDFYVHVTIYLTVNVMLFAIDMLTPRGPWFYWPLLLWGVGVAANGGAVLASRRFFVTDWEERKVAKLRAREAHAKHA